MFHPHISPDPCGLQIEMWFISKHTTYFYCVNKQTNKATNKQIKDTPPNTLFFLNVYSHIFYCHLFNDWACFLFRYKFLNNSSLLSDIFYSVL